MERDADRQPSGRSHYRFGLPRLPQAFKKVTRRQRSPSPKPRDPNLNGHGDNREKFSPRPSQAREKLPEPHQPIQEGEEFLEGFTRPARARNGVTTPSRYVDDRHSASGVHRSVQNASNIAGKSPWFQGRSKLVNMLQSRQRDEESSEFYPPAKQGMTKMPESARDSRIQESHRPRSVQKREKMTETDDDLVNNLEIRRDLSSDDEPEDVIAALRQELETERRGRMEKIHNIPPDYPEDATGVEENVYSQIQRGTKAGPPPGNNTGDGDAGRRTEEPEIHSFQLPRAGFTRPATGYRGENQVHCPHPRTLTDVRGQHPSIGGELVTSASVSHPQTADYVVIPRQEYLELHGMSHLLGSGGCCCRRMPVVVDGILCADDRRFGVILRSGVGVSPGDRPSHEGSADGSALLQKMSRGYNLEGLLKVDQREPALIQGKGPLNSAATHQYERFPTAALGSW